MREVISSDLATERLQILFPREAFDTVMSNPLAGAAITALIYVDAVCEGEQAPEVWARPSTVTWMSEAIRVRSSDDERMQWRTAAFKRNSDVVALLDSWGVEAPKGYADNSRETVRDETFRKWKEVGAIRENAAIAKNSSKGRWALESHFADLFDPSIPADEFVDLAAGWRESHLSPEAKLRVQFAAHAESSEHAVSVALPSVGGTRVLEAGRASLILKSLIENWAPARLDKPYVITVSEPGDKVYVADANLLNFIGLSINVSDLLPDAVIADVVDPVKFWFVEAVNTDGEINESRKSRLLEWAGRQGIAAENCNFLTAFSSRNDPAARRRLKDLAVGTFAYFADEPGNELAWYAIANT